MTHEGGRRRNGLYLVAFVAGLFIMSGIAGISVGGISAQAGWWLVVVGLILLVLVAIELKRR
jgi:hypothetical protein